MEPFSIFQTGGRQKFLKKRKDKKVKVQSQNKQINSALMVQKNIRRFLEYRQAYQSLQNKMQIEGDDQTSKLKYWLLTPYYIKTYELEWRVFQFWKSTNVSQNQVLISNISSSFSNNSGLIQRMVKLTIQTLPKLFECDFTETINICRQLFQICDKICYIINGEEVKQIIEVFQQRNDIEVIQSLRKKCIDLLMNNQQTKALGSEIFLTANIFLEYLIAQDKDYKISKAEFSKIYRLICEFYPKILVLNTNNDQSYANILSPHRFSQVCSIYTDVLRHVIKQQPTPQDALVFMAFLNYLVRRLKNSTTNMIVKNYNINPSIFQSQSQYQAYLQEKDEYFVLKDIIMGDYQKSKSFFKRALELVLQAKNKPTPQSQLITQQSIQFTFQIISMIGQNMELIPLNRALNYLYENVNEAIIYDIGRQRSSLVNSSSLSSENMLVLLLSIANKASQQTPDLYFVKFYQQNCEKEKLKRLIKQYFLKILKHTMFLPRSTSVITCITKTTICLLESLYNKIFRTKILPTDIFQNSSFIMKFKSYQYKNSGKDQVSMFLTKFPYVFPLQLRAFKFREILRNLRYQNINLGHQYFNDSEDQEDGYSNDIKIRRNYEFVEAFQKMRKRNMRRNFKITFINQYGFKEMGIDAGGLKKEFLNRVLKDVLSPNFGMFIQNDSHELLPHPIKAQLKEGLQTQYYQFIGKLIGLAIYQNITLGYKFSGTFLNAIVGKKNSFDDLKKIDPDLYKSLIYIKDMEEDARQLCLTFLYKDQVRKRSIQLKPNGHLIEVNNENKREYIALLTAYKVNKLLQHQTRFIRKGLTSMIEKDWLFMFNYEELNYLISGQGEIDVDDLKINTRIMGFENGSITIRLFWEIVREFNEDQKSKLLMFVTACPRPSFLGFKQLSPPFTIVNAKNDQKMLPISHTCSNVLELPDYKNKQTMRKKILTAIESNSGFQFG